MTRGAATPRHPGPQPRRERGRGWPRSTQAEDSGSWTPTDAGVASPRAGTKTEAKPLAIEKEHQATSGSGWSGRPSLKASTLWTTSSSGGWRTSPTRVVRHDGPDHHE